jgi:hypothetical protein
VISGMSKPFYTFLIPFKGPRHGTRLLNSTTLNILKIKLNRTSSMDESQGRFQRIFNLINQITLFIFRLGASF